MRLIDRQLFLWINGLAGRVPILDNLTLAIVNDYAIPVSLSLILLGLWLGFERPEVRERYQRAVLNATIAVGLANLIIDILNYFYFRPRPFAEEAVNLLFYRPTDSSFPSNPAAVAFAVAWAIYLRNRPLGVSLLILASLFSFSRVYAGVTYPLDALAGAAVGIIGCYLAMLVLRVTEPTATLALRLARRFYLA